MFAYFKTLLFVIDYEPENVYNQINILKKILLIERITIVYNNSDMKMLLLDIKCVVSFVLSITFIITYYRLDENYLLTYKDE